MSLKIVIAVLQPMRSRRADGQACTTANTALGMEPDFCRGPHALWIVTPETAEPAPLQKDCGTDPRPVVDRAALDVKNGSCPGQPAGLPGHMAWQYPLYLL